jgi:hypothetical protein
MDTQINISVATNSLENLVKFLDKATTRGVFSLEDCGLIIGSVQVIKKAIDHIDNLQKKS